MTFPCQFPWTFGVPAEDEEPVRTDSRQNGRRVLLAPTERCVSVPATPEEER